MLNDFVVTDTRNHSLNCRPGYAHFFSQCPKRATAIPQTNRVMVSNSNCFFEFPLELEHALLVLVEVGEFRIMEITCHVFSIIQRRDEWKRL